MMRLAIDQGKEFLPDVLGAGLLLAVLLLAEAERDLVESNDSPVVNTWPSSRALTL